MKGGNLMDSKQAFEIIEEAFDKIAEHEYNDGFDKTASENDDEMEVTAYDIVEEGFSKIAANQSLLAKASKKFKRILS